ncbi:MAG: hypothetical protein LLG44_08000 [Chloroflexi bacterium]|nr:hypothetical protein [Chloroflexota bacterium]
MTTLEHLQLILSATKPLVYPRGRRLPLYLWQLQGTPPLSDRDLADALRELDARGISMLAVWRSGAEQQSALEQALRLGRIQHELGLPVGVNCIEPLYAFFNGEAATTHIDAAGKSFFDDSFGARPMGCPFAIEQRYDAIREQVEYYARAYRSAGLPLAFAYSDWEVDGPLEWNDAWAHSKRCTRCRAQVPEIDDFASFQATLRRIRAEMQRVCYAEPLLSRWPQALVGNYAVYPHNGWRYWYDYFERFNPELPHQFDQGEPSRPWADEFGRSGYTFAMPVMYTWYRTFDWYTYSPDYRWFYNMLKVASNAGASAPRSLPIISFVHHSLTDPPASGAGHVIGMSAWAYEELLWHSLLRGHSTFFSWCPDAECGHEAPLLHRVWAEALRYREFLESGQPVSFTVPREEGAVVSGLRLGSRLLARRSDFGGAAGSDAWLELEGHKVPTPSGSACQIIAL